MVDFGFCGRAPLGTDLGQLVRGEVQTGHRRVADLPALEAACLDAYMAGVAAEGGGADATRRRRPPEMIRPVPAATGSHDPHLAKLVDDDDQDHYQQQR